jgi:hypothetical protein
MLFIAPRLHFPLARLRRKKNLSTSIATPRHTTACNIAIAVMAPSARVTMLLAAVLVSCVLLASRHADAAEAPAPAPGGFGCNPLKDKTCKPGDPKAPENQEEEGGFGARFPGIPLTIPGLGGPKIDRDGDGDTDEDDELPSFDTHMTILGH